ncbi:MAG TPA: tetratricopeptide repeat protein [Methylomirabilota bacterium]|nr:tetratricopeptide repeat protein [Methylomirabilota bacterium]
MTRIPEVARGVSLAAAALFVLGTAGGPAAQPRETDHVIQFYQARVARDPDDFLSYNKLGTAYVQKARDTGDIVYYDLAEKALRRSLGLVSQGPAASTATTWLAVVEFARHRFRDALAAAEQALALDPGEFSAYAVVGDAYLELGEYDKAAQAYGRLLDLSGPLHPHSRLAHLKFLTGEPEAAVAHMRRAVAAARGGLPGENIAWTHAQLGELLFQVGDLAGAEKAHQDALAGHPGYHRAQAGLAGVRAAQRRYADAIELYRKAISVVPLPEYAAALGDVYTKAGRASDAKQQYDLVEFIGRLNALNKTIYNRELALFYADHDMKPKEALALAEQELQARRDIYTYDVLGWALYRNGRPREAAAAMAEALRLGTRDARLYFHAGMIHMALGDAARARDYLSRALAINPRFHPLHADVATRVLAELTGGPRSREHPR